MNLVQFTGAEMPTSLHSVPVTNITRDTGNVDPVAGAASWACNQNVGSRDYRMGYGRATEQSGSAPQAGPVATSKRLGCGFAYRPGGTPAAGTAFGVCQLGFLSGTQQIINLCLRDDRKLEWYTTGTSSAQGTASGSVTSSALTTTTWYWIWMEADYPTAGGTITVNLWIDHVLVLTYSFTSTGDASSSISANIWAPAGATPASITGNIDNAIAVVGLDGKDYSGRMCRAAVKLASVTANGSVNDFTAVGAANRFDCVDEAAPNDDTDYVVVDSTAAMTQMFDMGDPTAPAGYERVGGVVEAQRHRNADAGKWAASHQARASFQGTAYLGGTAFSDPGATYNFPEQTLYRTGAGARLTRADIADMEMGMALSANASEAAEWRTTAIQGEVLYLPPVSLPPRARARTTR